MLLSGLLLIIIVDAIYSFLFADSNPLVTLTEGIVKLVTIAVGFYYWKAKCENLHKYKQDEKMEINDEN